MENYDNWKLDTPDEPENECDFCGEPCEGRYCSNVCKKEYMLNDIWQIYIDQPIRYKKMFFNEPIEDLIKYLEKYCN